MDTWEHVIMVQSEVFEYVWKLCWELKIKCLGMTSRLTIGHISQQHYYSFDQNK